MCLLKDSPHVTVRGTGVFEIYRGYVHANLGRRVGGNREANQISRSQLLAYLSSLVQVETQGLHKCDKVHQCQCACGRGKSRESGRLARRASGGSTSRSCGGSELVCPNRKAYEYLNTPSSRATSLNTFCDSHWPNDLAACPCGVEYRLAAQVGVTYVHLDRGVSRERQSARSGFKICNAIAANLRARKEPSRLHWI